MNIALIFAGGVGSRMGSSTPKQFLEWNGKPIIIQTLEVFENSNEIDGIVLVSKEDWIPYTKDLLKKYEIKKLVSIIPGGETALDSQYNGLKEIKKIYGEDQIIVLIHDGVRPLVDEGTITRNIDCVKKFGNAITATKAIETVILTDESGNIVQILDRSLCRMARAPQTFYLKDILYAHEKSIGEGKHTFIDSASLMTAYGFTLHTVEGEMENIKITTPSDYYMYSGIIKSREE